MHITATTLASACQHIQQQFAAHSWWPKAPPAQAQHEFTLMQQDPVALTRWCEKWLDSGQQRQLQQALKP